MDTKDLKIKLMCLKSDVFQRETINDEDVRWIRKELTKITELVNNLPIGSVMPRSLTAENGGKALLNGEFNETYEAYDETEGDYNVDVPVQWTTIKDIYKKIVDHYGA